MISEALIGALQQYPPEAVLQLLNSMKGIASCATDSGCCEMHRRIAREAVDRFTSSLPQSAPDSV